MNHEASNMHKPKADQVGSNMPRILAVDKRGSISRKSRDMNRDWGVRVSSNKGAMAEREIPRAQASDFASGLARELKFLIV